MRVPKLRTCLVDQGLLVRDADHHQPLPARERRCLGGGPGHAGLEATCLVHVDELLERPLPALAAREGHLPGSPLCVPVRVLAVHVRDRQVDDQKQDIALVLAVEDDSGSAGCLGLLADGEQLGERLRDIQPELLEPIVVGEDAHGRRERAKGEEPLAKLVERRHERQ